MQIDAVQGSPSRGLADKSSPVRLADEMGLVDKSSPVRLADEMGLADKSSPVRLADEIGLAETISPVRLEDLPVELLLHIFQYLEVKFITEVLARVCSLFRYRYLVAFTSIQIYF
jgi:hypothetical protein